MKLCARSLGRMLHGNDLGLQRRCQANDPIALQREGNPQLQPRDRNPANAQEGTRGCAAGGSSFDHGQQSDPQRLSPRLAGNYAQGLGERAPAAKPKRQAAENSSSQVWMRRITVGSPGAASIVSSASSSSASA